MARTTSTTGPWVLGDRTRLRQIALNLISNAVKFTSEGQVQLAMTVIGNEVFVSVSDSGVGISSDEQAKIFGEFYSSPAAVQSGKSGLGLGLAISKQLIEQHGGHLEVCSPGHLGKGSTFSFCLPIISESEIAIGLLPSPTEIANRVVVLAESDGSTKELADYLKLRGFDLRVYRVDKDSQWLSKTIQTKPAAIILEQNLASREGWAIIGMLKRQSATKNIPVLACSLHAEDNQGQILELNYLHKPLKLDQLTKELERFSPCFK